MDEFGTTTELNRLLDLLRQGQDAAREGLIAHAQDRLRAKAKTLLNSHPEIRGPVGTDDVLQVGLLRLHNALAEFKPESLAAFFWLASRHIRFALIDLLRQQQRRAGRKSDRPPTSPSEFVQWIEFHEQVEHLPVELRQVVDLLWYHGMSQREAAHVLGWSLGKLQSRWAAAQVVIQRTISPPR